MTTVISLLGGPGVGKSTLAALLYARMKTAGMDVELVREAAKEWVHEGRKIGPFEQIAILGEQIKRESALFDKVDYIVTDSPAVLGSFYFNYNHSETFMCRMVNDYYKYAEYKNIKFVNILLPRSGEYSPKGRYEDEEQAKKVDVALENYLNFHDYKYRKFTIHHESEWIIEYIMKDLK